MTAKPLPTMIDLTPLNEIYRTDPHVVLDDLRSRCPVHDDTVSGSMVLSRYADVRATVSNRDLWRDPLRSAEDSAARRRFVERADLSLPRSSLSSILTLDDPDHARIRHPLTQALYARVARFRPEVERIVGEALDGMEGLDTFDLMERFCVPIPIDTIASILGVDHDRLDDFRTWSEGTIQGLNPFRTPEQTEIMETASASLSAAAERNSVCARLLARAARQKSSSASPAGIVTMWNCSAPGCRSVKLGSRRASSTGWPFRMAYRNAVV